MTTYTLLRHGCAHWVPILAFVAAATFGFMSPDATEANILLTEPVHGTFTTAAQTVATGRVEMADLSNAALTVNGTAVPLAADGSFSHSVALDAARIFNPVLVELTVAGDLVARQRPVIIAGPSLPATALAPESLAVRLTDGGLDQLELLVLRSVDLDIATFLPPGPLFTQEVCVEIPLLPDICTDVEVSISDNPAPRVGSIDIDLDAATNQLNLQLTLQDLFVRAQVEAVDLSCTMTATAASMLANGAIRLEPSAADPTAVDVIQAGDIAITFSNFDTNTDCGGIIGDLIEEFLDLLVDNIRDLLQDGLEDFLNTVDAAGNTPLADILEDLLSVLSLESVINEAIAEIGLQTRVPFARIAEDSGGVTFVIDTGVDLLPAGTCADSQDNPALAAVYDVPQPLPALGSATPGGLPFDAGGAASATLLNQALRGATACGLLQVELTEIDIGGDPTPITAGLLGAFLPAFAQLDPAQPIQVVLRPTLAPVVSGAPGPAGELIDLRVSAYLLELFIPDDPAPLMQLALDLEAGLDALLDPATGGVQPRIGDVADLSALLIINPLGVDPSRIDFFIDLLLPQVDDLNDDLEPIEIPSVEGIDFEIVEVSPIGTYLGVFLDFVVQP
ncbi:hypothetical protein [Candidatus Entotheonella palauensis]|uniref:hypothetical protein n=1 Tax=Candidatus Entotheonella palauensis TaxID=93172 RepID=UPI000B7F1638|nr:hypothetical protein [Candidatus Entotheonella palauensis]